jgi:hypothetical protein
MRMLKSMLSHTLALIFVLLCAVSAQATTPSITSLTPNTGAVGSSIVIAGANQCWNRELERHEHKRSCAVWGVVRSFFGNGERPRGEQPIFHDYISSLRLVRWGYWFRGACWERELHQWDIQRDGRRGGIEWYE